MTPQEAFNELIHNTPYIQTLPTKERNSIGAYKSMYGKKKLTLKNIDTLLQRHGYQKVAEPVWEKKVYNRKQKQPHEQLS